jgi:hypothetical protein
MIKTTGQAFGVDQLTQFLLLFPKQALAEGYEMC